MDSKHSDNGERELIKRLEALEARVSRIEKYNHIESFPLTSIEKSISDEHLNNVSGESLLESRIGESGLAWLGNLVLFFGITFLVQYIEDTGNNWVSSIFGYISVAAIFGLAHYIKHTFPKMASIFNLNAYLLLFYVTLRLHFFTDDPIIESKIIGIVALSLVSVFQFFISVQKKSILLAGIAFLFLSIIAIISNTTHFMLSVSALLALMSIIFLYRFGWIRLIYFSLILVYVINIIWFINNPMMGNELKAVSYHNFGYLYLFIIGAIYSLSALVNKTELYSTSGIVGSIILNGIGFSTLLLLYVLSFFKEDYVILLGSVSVFCLLFSVLLQVRSEWKITAALFALYGFVTLSIAVYGLYDFPLAYFVLAIQSLLVVIMAIWFRSKFIIIMNTILFLVLLLLYLRMSLMIDGVNISFSIVALITARILNWKKDRLTIKTDMLRNIYLLTGFVMVLITLYNLFPARYITLSWTAAAVIYFVMSLILKNVKYRYLALGTMLAAAFYLFIIDLARIELVFRILALMFLAIISIGFSIYYSKRSKK
ncbi:MAG: hypothetical protein HQ521_14790 [Bacteroidetes bacterium]|nr:hypothetical protein [Bacteroidota bacterium]